MIATINSIIAVPCTSRSIFDAKVLHEYICDIITIWKVWWHIRNAFYCQLQFQIKESQQQIVLYQTTDACFNNVKKLALNLGIFVAPGCQLLQRKACIILLRNTTAAWVLGSSQTLQLIIKQMSHSIRSTIEQHTEWRIWFCRKYCLLKKSIALRDRNAHVGN